MFDILCKTLQGNILFSCPLAYGMAAWWQISIRYNALKNKGKHAISKMLIFLCSNLTLANQLHHITLIRVPVFSLTR